MKKIQISQMRWNRKKHKIDLLKTGQQEIINQLRLLAEELRGPTQQNGDENYSSNQLDLKGPITHKKMTMMLAKARADYAFNKKGNIPKYPPEMDLVPYPPKFQYPKLQSNSGTSSAY